MGVFLDAISAPGKRGAGSKGFWIVVGSVGESEWNPNISDGKQRSLGAKKEFCIIIVNPIVQELCQEICH